MQFNQSIPLLSRPKFSEGTKLSSSRDDRNNAFLWKKGALSAGQLDATNQAIEKLSREFSKQRRKPLGGFVPQEPINAFYPFKIYQPSNVSSFLTGITFLDPSSGVGTVCNIDSTVPTNFASTPPTVNPSETWRFWSVRSGQVEIRPIYTLLLLGNEYYSDDGDLIHDPNNWGWKYEVSKNSDGNSPFVHRSDDIDYDSQTTETILPPLIINDNNNFAGAVSL
jgi:hypothetical protein